MGKLVLSLLYVLPVLLLAMMWCGNRLHTRWKIVVLAVLPLFYAAHWAALEFREGWPLDAALPAEFSLLDARIIEPNKQTGHNGAIYIWLQQSSSGKPRSYQLPYDRRLHEQLHQSVRRLQAGHLQIGYSRGRESGGKGAPAGNGMMLEVKDTPALKLPPKTL